jgi:hypothetical protein
VNRAEGSSANEDWFNPNTSFFPQCATSTIESALTECGNDEACANQKVFEGQIISLSEDEGVVIFDKQCNAISKTEEEVDDNQGEDNDGDGKGGNKDKDGADSKALPDQCIFAVIKYDSPISLLVEDESVLTTDATLVQFPLDPNAPTNWVEWRGSAKAPLLVFDPTHSGNITRADQLFGHWTFGGQAQASLNGSLAATPWKNGYEALGTLDLNNDGQISGSELSDLGLWFDNNQDAVTQAGEVKPVTEAGVDALYYKNPTQPEDSRNLYLSVGYRGSLAGQGQIGTSVDWFARSAQSRHELLAELLAGTGELELETSTEDQQSPQNQPGVTTLKHSPLRGVYTWKEAIDDPTAGQGLLTFNEVAPGKVTGLSATEMEINKEWAAKTGGERALAFRRFEGTITRDGDSASVSFIIEGQATRTVSTMALTPNGATAQGSSEVTSRIKSGERKAVKYTWNAQRILAK